MVKPKYKEFDNVVEPVVKDFRDVGRGHCVLVVASHENMDEITTGLNAKELRELADYLEKMENG